MIKKITINQLRPGIFVHDFNCDKSTSNRILNPTLIKDAKIIEILRSWGIKEVYIDTERGLDVEKAKSQHEVNAEIESAFHKLAQKHPESSRSVPLKEELAVAKNIKTKATSVIENAMSAVRAGKPLDVDSAVELVDEMDRSLARNKDALVLLTRIRQKDEYTLMHSISVGAYVLNFCNLNKLPHDRTIALAIGALFHDIGKTKIPLAILNKPGKLTDAEFDEMKRHSLYSAEVLRSAKDLPDEAYDMGLHHHERYDGTGYPHGLKGEAISYGSQLCAIADVYDALTSDRCYKVGIDRIEGLRKLYEWSDYHFNKELTYEFIRGIGVYPIGTCVKLESGRIGVVIGSTESADQPVVRLFYDENKQMPLLVHDLDLLHSEDRVSMYEDAAKWDLKKMNIFGDVSADLFPI
nr:HD-GYP domain-containing protein [Desulfobulbaceae bacterium]